MAGSNRRPPSRPGARAAPSGGRAIQPGAVVASPGAVRRIAGPMFIDTAAGTFQDLRPLPPAVMTKREFDAELQRLLRVSASDEANPGSIHSTGCRRCVSCTFCTGCDECHHCTHCKTCKSSTHLTHCTDCVGCHDCAYCVSTENCTRSNYLVLCRACSECSYCFGCVGLVKQDFHILNVKYTRSEYFRIVKSLEEELGLR
jgi:hypothetical protein